MAIAKKIPMRMCIGCQEMKPKRELIRVVKDNTNNVCIDPTGRKNGRGAYICKSNDCFKKVKKTRKFEKVFFKPVDDSFYDLLAEHIKDLVSNSEK